MPKDDRNPDPQKGRFRRLLREKGSEAERMAMLAEERLKQAMIYRIIANHPAPEDKYDPRTYARKGPEELELEVKAALKELVNFWKEVVASRPDPAPVRVSRPAAETPRPNPPETPTIVEKAPTQKLTEPEQPKEPKPIIRPVGMPTDEELGL